MSLWRPTGPQSADILIVGEYPSYGDLRAGMPFAGESGKVLDSLITGAGLQYTPIRKLHALQGYLSNKDFPTKTQIDSDSTLLMGRYVSQDVLRSYKILQAEITETSPKIIIPLGEVAMWMVTGLEKITKRRGSMYTANGACVIPTYSPSKIIKMWEWRFIAGYDFQKASRQLRHPTPEPDYKFITRPSYAETIMTLDDLYHQVCTSPTRIAVDIETRQKQIDCIGLGWSATEAICIPFFSMTEHGSYYTEDEELSIVLALRELLTHPNCQVIGQNFLYDNQYIARHWGYYVKPLMDTMIAHAVLFPGLPKALDFLASLYLPFHQYWKDDLKEANTNSNDSQRWEYNCKDCIVTWELYEPLQKSLLKQQLTLPYKMEMDQYPVLMKMMMRGVKIDLELRNEFTLDLIEQRSKLVEFFESLSVWDDVPLVMNPRAASEWYDSPTQLRKIFYELLGLKPITKKGAKAPTTDNNALTLISKREPILAPLCHALQDYRSMGVFLSTFVSASLDSDKRMRCSYSPVGTETFRWNSSEDAFGFGTNLQNIPTGGK